LANVLDKPFRLVWAFCPAVFFTAGFVQTLALCGCAASRIIIHSGSTAFLFLQYLTSWDDFALLMVIAVIKQND